MVYKTRVAFLSRWRWPLLAALLLLAPLLGASVHHWLIAAGVFLRVEKAREPAWLVHYAEQPFGERMVAEGRLYSPTSSRGAILLVHGMHQDGIEDPRMIGFARALCGAGYTVLTPRMDGLARYQLVPEDVQRIKGSAARLASLTHREQVIVFGVSFGGGMAIRAACEGAPAIERVVALGAHQDAERVARFYLGEPALGPHGENAKVEPHPYGPFALWRSLFGQNHQGELAADERERARAGIEARQDLLKAVSPSGCVRLKVPLYLVHGSGDRVVPYTETLLNQQQFAPQVHVRTLISPAIVHAEYDPPGLLERLQLISFVVAALW